MIGTGMLEHTDLKSTDTIVGDHARDLHGLWQKLTGERPAPRREEITLSLVRTLTPWQWTVDVIDNGADFRFRLVGDRITQFYGNRITGLPLSQLPNSPFFERLKQMLTYCVEHRRPVALGPIRSSREGREHWEVEALVVPFSEDGETINCLMGTMELWPVDTGGAAG